VASKINRLFVGNVPQPACCDTARLETLRKVAAFYPRNGGEGPVGKSLALKPSQPQMADGNAKADEYQRQAAACIEVAERMSATTDRIRMFEMAQRWLEMAKEAESKAGSGS
jgi:hypothetical protein